jgi:hypothetical protein
MVAYEYKIIRKIDRLAFGSPTGKPIGSNFKIFGTNGFSRWNNM